MNLGCSWRDTASNWKRNPSTPLQSTTKKFRREWTRSSINRMILRLQNLWMKMTKTFWWTMMKMRTCCFKTNPRIKSLWCLHHLSSNTKQPVKRFLRLLRRGNPLLVPLITTSLVVSKTLEVTVDKTTPLHRVWEITNLNSPTNQTEAKCLLARWVLP